MVLPSIRQHGAYLTREKLWEVATSPEAHAETLLRPAGRARGRTRRCREDNARLQGKAAYYDLFIDLHAQHQPPHHRQGAGRAGAALCPLPAGTAICLPRPVRQRAALRQRHANDGHDLRAGTTATHRPHRLLHAGDAPGQAALCPVCGTCILLTV